MHAKYVFDHLASNCTQSESGFIIFKLKSLKSRQRRLIGLVRQFVFHGVSDRLIQRIFTLIELFLSALISMPKKKVPCDTSTPCSQQYAQLTSIIDTRSENYMVQTLKDDKHSIHPFLNTLPSRRYRTNKSRVAVGTNSFFEAFYPPYKLCDRQFILFSSFYTYILLSYTLF